MFGIDGFRAGGGVVLRRVGSSCGMEGRSGCFEGCGSGIGRVGGDWSHDGRLVSKILVFRLLVMVVDVDEGALCDKESAWGGIRMEETDQGLLVGTKCNGDR